MPKTPKTDTERRLEEIEIEIAGLKTADDILRKEEDALNNQIDALVRKRRIPKERRQELYFKERQLRDEITKLTKPQPKFGPFDVVEDELGVRYRVTDVGHTTAYYDQPASFYYYGIRLNKDGVEAHVKPRRIHSDSLTKVN